MYEMIETICSCFRPTAMYIVPMKEEEATKDGTMEISEWEEKQQTRGRVPVPTMIPRGVRRNRRNTRLK